MACFDTFPRGSRYVYLPFSLHHTDDLLPNVGPLAGSFPLLSLRTCKADVVVGIDQNTADELDKSGEKWRVNGRWVFGFWFFFDWVYDGVQIRLSVVPSEG